MDHRHAQFGDRAEAGRLLAERLAGMGLARPVVYALPRGGVPVALEVARRLGAPLDLVLVRKIAAPGQPELALGAIVDGASPQTVINEDVRRHTGADDAWLDRAAARELAELERRRALYLGDRAQVLPAGRTAVVVDDGLATGATMKAALTALRRQGATRICVAVPVAPLDALAGIEDLADQVVCLHPARVFPGVGAFYDDFHQLSDDETVRLLRQGWSTAAGPEGDPPGDPISDPPEASRDWRAVSLPPLGLEGGLAVPAAARGLVLFVHGSGSSRLSPRNRAVAEALNARGFATLLFDLLTPTEARQRRNVFDIDLLAERVIEAVAWSRGEPDVADLPLGLFGASTGAAAALVAAAELGRGVAAVVARGGRPDLAGDRLGRVRSPTLLVVGGDDLQVIGLNRQALAALGGEKRLEIVPGAGHLFEEPGTLAAMTALAGDWFDRHLQPAVPPLPAGPEPHLRGPEDIGTALRRSVRPLPAPEDPAFAEAFDSLGSARVVLLGEATHGSSEFYRARAAITRRLIERHGFTLVAVEADWPDAAAIDRQIRSLPPRPDSRPPFGRFPAWMWRNREVDDFVAFLGRHNAAATPQAQVRFHGLDLYSLSASVAEVLGYLDRIDPTFAAEARARYACFDPWTREPAAYGRASLGRGYAICERPVARILVELLEKELDFAARDGDDFFDAVENARLVADAERYYRIMYHGSTAAWNLRDRHMFDTLARILDRAGPAAKAVVWAHNSHIGDARSTDMGGARGELNIGQLCREAWGGAAALIGFGTHGGTVAAASEWDAPMEVKPVRPARADSYEALLHGVGLPRFLIDLRAGGPLGPALRRALAEPRLERYIGVIYRPETERWSHYSHAVLPDQYDAFVWLDETRAVTPLPARVRLGEEETYPTGL